MCPKSAPAHVTPPQIDRPADFDDFWNQTLASLRANPLLYRVGTCVAAPEDAHIAPVKFRSLGGVMIQGFLVSRDRNPATPAAARRPLVVTAHGYNSQCNPALEARHVARGVDVFCFDVRGCGLSRNATATDPAGYVITGLTRPETSILRGAVCDYIRAAEVAMRLHRSPTSRLVFHGRSFGGGLAIMAQAVSKYASYLAVSVPTFGWAAGRRRLVRQGSGREINDYLERHPSREGAVMRTLGYFDTVNFASLIQCPAMVGIGRRDEIVPRETVTAIVRQMPPSTEVVELPVSHSTDPAEARWDGFDRRWTAVASALS